MAQKNDLPSPQRLGPYEVRAKIAEGGMATVYVARRVDGGAGGNGGIVAIKMIRDEFSRSPEFLTMFMDEAKIVSRLSHPNIVSYQELGNDDGHVFLAMELLIGQSLWSVWEACRSRKVRLRYDVIAWIGARAADGLHYAHEFVGDDGHALEIVHRDVNATNVFVTYDGQIKVIDFGLAKAANRASRTAAGVIKGKVAYMSPEQAVGASVDRRTDVFALGTTLWELACDRRLFKHSDDVETLRSVHAAVVPDPTKLVDDFPEELWRILRRALERMRESRYPTAAELARDLDAFARTAGTGVNDSTVADVMGALFADDRSRQAAWVADASGPDKRRAPRAPLKARSAFWAPDEVTEAPVSSATGHRPKRRRALSAAVAIAVVLAAVGAVVLALR
ncbi:MAG: serine/threonine protein kinase [Polyangiaceae bacterium]